MALAPEEANKLKDLRHRILANVNQGNPPHAGIEREELQEAIRLCRKDYTANQAKSKASGVSSPGAPGPEVDLSSLFTNKKSK